MKTDPRMIDVNEDSPQDDRPVDTPILFIESGKSEALPHVKNCWKKISEPECDANPYPWEDFEEDSSLRGMDINNFKKDSSLMGEKPSYSMTPPDDCKIKNLKPQEAFNADKEEKIDKRNSQSKTLFFIDIIALIVVASGILFFCIKLGSGYFHMPVYSSISDSENIDILKKPYSPTAKGTVLTSDSVLGVAFDMYSLSGLKASLETTLPSTNDKSVALFMRSADYYPDGTLIGKVVIDGEEIPAKGRENRWGYVAISKDGKPALGISNNNKVANHVALTGGSFFRQFVLLGDGELPDKFALHGKVERAAIGRMADGELFYIVTHDKETMYDFADALREYGFVDAVYITGGNNYTFYRDTLGNAHYSPLVLEKIEKYNTEPLPAPLLVFRTNDI